MKEMNTAMIMNLLHKEGRLTRKELSVITQLSATTVSVLIEELITKNYVEEIGEQISSGAGRKAISLQINKDSGYVIGISLGNNFLICAFMNLHGECISEYQTKIATGNDSLGEQINAALISCMNQVEGLNMKLIKGIGISTPGIIDELEETVVYSSFLKLSHFNLRKQLEVFFPQVPIKIVNDSNAAAFAEHYSGAGKDKNSLLYMTINEGIGAGIILNSHIHSGYKGGAGEIGHLPVDPDGEICNCGERGCVETILTSPFILKKCQQRSAELGRAIPQTFEEIIALYEADEDWLEPIFNQVLSTTTLLITSTVNFISPEAVIIEGWMNRSAKFSEKLRVALEKFPFPFEFTRDRLLPASYGEKGALYGAATLMLHRIFRASILE
ncbi:ROK family transcriptional regulator [Cohnella abietis]|uniref:Serine/threonine protein kinase n=1 Tax=Cohnella abietis TaxID=2507935 RepID=A0A3T1DBD3_9BACL|nr:ROK family transcriptional regulator [Cohnella abietis]BBI35417.1 serine/threonine protein kinase [Cohnella abietis]